jgi:hypothetical protein
MRDRFSTRTCQRIFIYMSVASRGRPDSGPVGCRYLLTALSAFCCASPSHACLPALSTHLHALLPWSRMRQQRSLYCMYEATGVVAIFPPQTRFLHEINALPNKEMERRLPHLQVLRLHARPGMPHATPGLACRALRM